MSKEKFSKLNPQPFHEKLEGIKQLFVARRIGDPMTEEGFKGILASEVFQETFINETEGLIAEEGARDMYKTLVKNTFRDVNDPFASFSTEGAEMAPTSNYNQFARLNPWSILGYVARSKAIEMYHTITFDRPTVTYEYNIPYVMKGNSDVKHVLPHAIRNGTLSHALDLPEALPLVASGSHVLDATGWLAMGTASNLLSDAGFAPNKHALERNIMIKSIRYNLPTSLTGEAAAITGELDVYIGRQSSTGDVGRRVFHEEIPITYTKANSTKAVVKTYITGFVNLDTGEYTIANGGAQVLTAFKFGDAKVTNLANEMGTMRAGNTKYVQNFDVENRSYMTVPITPEISDDFNAAGDGVTFVAYMTDKLTEAYSGIRDNDMEDKLDAAYDRDPATFPLHVKLGGYKMAVPFLLSARGPGGDNPFSWQREGLKDTLRHTFTDAETYGLFETGVPRQWVILGHEKDTQRLPDISYANDAGDAAGSAEGGTFKYGFAIDSAAGYIDNFGRRVRVIGSHYGRHNNKPMRAVLKSMSIEQPTTVYFPYSFRVYSGISPEYRNRPALMIATRDYIGLLSSFQARITLMGNDASMYTKMAAFSAGRTDANPIP